MGLTARAWLAVVCGVLAAAMVLDRSALGADVLRGVAALERCVRARPADGTYADLRPVTGLVLNAYLLLASVLAARPRGGVPGLAVRVDVPWSTALVWFQAGYFAVALVRVWDADTTCGTHANGISGHYLYYVYYAALFWLHVRHTTTTTAAAGTATTASTVAVARVLRVVLEALRVAYTVCALAVLHTTYAGGFHSLRQVVLGLLLSAVFAATAVLWCRRYPPAAHARCRRRRAALLLAGNALGLACLAVLCVRGERPTAYRELALYAVALALALFHPTI